jgi:O-antigen ligase/tetratricopeptide (TPR) repeat protein
MEVLLLALVVLSPWAFGSVDPIFELLLAIGIAGLLGLWVTVVIIQGRLNWVRCPAALCLIGLTLVGLLQLVPLPEGLLRIVSPNSVALRAELTPEKPEVVTAGSAPMAPPARNPISVYPYATRCEIVRWIGILALFAVVRNHLTTTAAFRRLSAVALINGVLLALFGMAQLFASKRTTVYGFESAGEVLGPFINRNHFASYLNLCLTLGVGLLLTLGPSEGERRRRMVQKPNALGEQDIDDAAFFSPFAVLHSPAQMWVCVGLAVTLAGVLGSFSRGGAVSLVVGIVAAGAASLSAGGPRVRRLELLILPAVVLIGILAWTGIRPLESRLSTLWQGGAFDKSRWSMWVSILRLVPMFPVFGCGYGTLLKIEPISRYVDLFPDLSQFDLIEIDHAHNDYLEGLVEGGILRLVLTVALVAFVLIYGVRAVRRWTGRTPGALAFGGLAAMAALAAHSFVEFSITTPAVAVLAAAIAAHLMSLTRSDPTNPPSAAHSGVMYDRLNRLGQVGVAILFVSIGLVLVLQTWQEEKVQQLRLEAFRAKRAKPADRKRAFRVLMAATRIAPDNADVHVELGQEFLNAWHDQVELRQVVVARPVLAAGSIAASGLAPLSDVGLVFLPDINRRVPHGWAEALQEDLVLPGLREMITARNICPLLPRPHMRLAAHARALAQADPPAKYWERARRLAPYDSDLWYFSGMQARQDGRTDEAWDQWRRSLTLSRKHLPAIVSAADAAGMLPGEMLTRLLPDDTLVLFEAARRLEPGTDSAERTRPLWERVLALLNAREELGPADYYIKANALRRLDQPKAALAAYRQAVDMNLSGEEWRAEYARYLEVNREYKEALGQVLYIEARTGLSPQLKQLKDNLQQQLNLQPPPGRNQPSGARP